METAGGVANELLVSEMKYWRAFAGRLFVVTAVFLLAVISKDTMFNSGTSRFISAFTLSDFQNLPSIPWLAAVLVVSAFSIVNIAAATKRASDIANKLGIFVPEPFLHYRLVIIILAIIAVASAMDAQGRITSFTMGNDYSDPLSTFHSNIQRIGP